MGASTAIQHQGPLAHRDTLHRHDAATSWPSALEQDRYHNFGSLHQRPLTPPPDMNGYSQPAKAGNDTRYSYNSQPAHPHYLPPSSVAHSLPQPRTASQNHSHTSATQSRPDWRTNATMEPVSRATPVSTDNAPGRASQADAIAPSFQIPRSVNDSGGSLSDLAARMACLFWFESSDLLRQIEDSPVPLQPSRQLAPDAIPTTGFRKWVTTILSTTCVAQNVVLLALLFVHRLKKLNPAVRGKPGSEYRLLTVALMLGNKFLDDNTYTNKTWAEVSGINVAEVHVMEVEFLSNMKYCLFTSADDWAKWQSLLGRFASYFELASRPLPITVNSSQASLLHLPMALPSPPSSNHASPPYAAEQVQAASSGLHGPTPAPSPLSAARKRSIDDHSYAEPPAKRLSSYQPQGYRQPYTTPATHAQPAPAYPRVTLPSLHLPPVQPPINGYPAMMSQGQQLPPLIVPQRAIAMSHGQATGAILSATPSQPSSQYHSRQASPFVTSGAGSPLDVVPRPVPTLQPPAQLSPTRLYLQQRSSPYRPVHDVSTLICPPSAGAMHHRNQSVDHDQMHYQALGKSSQQRQTGRLPYISQNIWLEGDSANGGGHQAMTPVHQWPSFAMQHRPSHLVPQH